MSNLESDHQTEIERLASDHEKEMADREQKARFELKKIVADFERKVAERDRQISQLTTVEAVNARSNDPERQLRSMERELSEKNAAVEQLVVMYEKQLKDQAAELQQEFNGRVQAQSEKHQLEIDGLMEEFRSETKQWVVERQQMNDELDASKHDRDQMVHEMKRLSDLLDSVRNGSPPQNKHLHSDPFVPSQSSVMSGSLSSPGFNGNSNNGSALQLHEATEYEYLRNILLEYMLGRETNVLWRVIATVMRFTDDQMNEIAAREDARNVRNR